MSIYQQIFKTLEQPMIILHIQSGLPQIEDANDAFLRLTGYTLTEVQSKSSHYLLQKYKLKSHNNRQFINSENLLYTKLKRPIPVRVTQQQLPSIENDKSNRSYITFVDLSGYKWIEQQTQKNKVLISGIIDSHQQIRFLRDSFAPLMFEPDVKMEEESVLNFIASAEHTKFKEALAEADLLKKERSLIIHTSKLSGIELELSVTFTPILDGFENSKEFAFVIWDVKPLDDKIDAAMKLKIWMARRDITAGQLSDNTGISIQTISKLRNGKIIKPQRLTAELIASELQVDVHEIWTSVRK